jgi:predicted MFS family arabinose efflux permease
VSYPGRVRVFAVQSGALLGPLAGGLVSPILIDIGASFDTTTERAATSLTAYFIPFALLLFVSGTLGERLGRKRVVRWAYVVFVIGLLMSALATSLDIFLAGRAIQGLANAFATPLLLAGLSEMVPPHRRGKAIGVFAGFQAAGQSLAALLGAVTATATWRLAFVAVAVVAGLMALTPPPGEPRPRQSSPRLRGLLNLEMLLLCSAGFLAFAGAAGVPFLVALEVQERMGLSVVSTGLLLAGFGVSGLCLGHACGALAQRFGAVRASIVAAVGGGTAVATIGFAQSVWQVAAAWAVAGAFMAMLNVALQMLTLTAQPHNRGGAISLVAALRFTGSAVAPLIWLPLFVRSSALAFPLVGLVTGLAALSLLGAGRRGQLVRTEAEVADSDAALVAPQPP